MRTLTKYVLLFPALLLFSGCIVTISIQPDKKSIGEMVDDYPTSEVAMVFESEYNMYVADDEEIIFNLEQERTK